MLSILLVQALYLSFIIPIGLSVTRLVAPKYKFRIGDRLVFAFWSGILFCGNILTLASFFWPLSPVTGLLTTLPLTSLALLNPSTRNDLREMIKEISLPFCLLLVSIWIGFSFFSALPSYGDTGGYHFPVIKWLSQFGTVPGLGLILYPAGISTSWFPLSAPLNFGLLENHCQGIVNGLAYMFFTLQAALAFIRIVSARAYSADRFFLGAWLIIWPFLERVTLMSINTIVHMGIATWGAIFLLLYAHDRDKSVSVKEQSSLLLLFSALIASIKLLTLPLLGFALYWIAVTTKGHIRFNIPSILLAVFAFICPIAYSSLTIGYPFFLSSIFALPLPWTPTPSELIPLQKLVYEYLSCFHGQICDLKGWDWFLAFLWDARCLCGLMAFSLLTIAKFFFSKKQSDTEIAISLILLGIAGSIVVIARGPSLGYGLGWIALIPATLFFTQGLLFDHMQRFIFAILPFILLFPRLIKTKFEIYIFIALMLCLILMVFIPKVVGAASQRFRLAPSLLLAFLVPLLFIGQGLDLAIRDGTAISSRILIPDLIFPIGDCRFEQKKFGELYLWQVIQNSISDPCECWQHDLPCTGAHAPFSGASLRHPERGIGAGFKLTP